MSQTWLYRLFGIGGIPKKMRPVLEAEAVVLLEEGLGGTVTLRNFRAPGRRHSLRKSWFSGSLVVTEIRLAAFQFGKPLVNVGLDDEQLKKLSLSVEGNGDVLRIDFEAGDFDERASGKVECRFKTDKARAFLERIERAMGE